MIIFNAHFDIRMLRQTSEAYGLNTEWIDTITPVCAMRLSAQAYGATNGYGTISLTDAAAAAGVEWSGPAHSASIDAQVTLEVVMSLKNYYELARNELMIAKGGRPSNGDTSNN